MMTLTETQYIKKLKKLLTKDLPKGLRIIYDTHHMRLYVIRDGFEFIDNHKILGGTSWHGVLTPVAEPDGSEGNVCRHSWLY